MSLIVNHTSNSISFNIADKDITDCNSPLPSHSVVKDIAQICRRFFFKGYYGSSPDDFSRLKSLLINQMSLVIENELSCRETADKFMSMLPDLKDMLCTDVEATYNGDPAATGFSEVVLCYPGIYAITNHRIAHALHTLDVPLIPRMISEQAHSVTGIDIHPAANIGPEFMIDHGTGVVIGATCVIGRHVKIYQGVTLGARSFETDDNGNPVKGLPRHPLVEDNVVIYSNATILGRVTIGKGAVIGGNVWLTRNVLPGEKIVQAEPEKLIRSIK